MNKYRVLCLLLLPIFFASESWSEPDTGAAPGFADRPAWVSGEVLVKFKSNVRHSAALHYQTRHGLQSMRRLPLGGVDHMRLPPDMSVEDAVQLFRQDPDVEFAEPNYYRHALAPKIPDDTYFGRQWGLNQESGQTVNGIAGTEDADIDAPEAWGVAANGTDCGNVVIAVIDSGIDPYHPDLEDNLWVNTGETPGNGVDDDGNGYIDDIHGWNFIDYNPPVYKGNNDIIDSRVHGSKVAGIIAAKGDNGLGITGVCWSGAIMALTFMNPDGDGSVVDEVAAIDYAIANGAKVINASFGDYQISTTESQAIQRAESAGILFVVAAGNNGVNNDTSPIYPASYDHTNIISVAATDQDDNFPAGYWSNYGFTTVDLAAPGGDRSIANIFSTIPGRDTVWTEDFERDAESPSAIEPDGWTLTIPPWQWDTADSINPDDVHSDGNRSLSTRGQTPQEGTALAQAIDISTYSGLQMSFYLRRVSLLGNDTLYVETSVAGSAWVSRPVQVDKLSVVDDDTETTDVYPNGINGQFTDWRKGLVSLSDLDGESTVQIRFRVYPSSGTGTTPGWYVDYVQITAAASDYTDSYDYAQGTSFAAPFVSGSAALVWNRYPSLSYCQVKYALINGGDLKPVLNGKVASGKRLNLKGAFDLAASPEDLPDTCTSPPPGGGGSSSSCFIRSLLN